jgi:hypothetical protein
MNAIPNATQLADQYLIRHPPETGFLTETIAQGNVIGHATLG